MRILHIRSSILSTIPIPTSSQINFTLVAWHNSALSRKIRVQEEPSQSVYGTCNEKGCENNAIKKANTKKNNNNNKSVKIFEAARYIEATKAAVR